MHSVFLNEALKHRTQVLIEQESGIYNTQIRTYKRHASAETSVNIGRHQGGFA